MTPLAKHKRHSSHSNPRHAEKQIKIAGGPSQSPSPTSVRDPSHSLEAAKTSAWQGFTPCALKAHSYPTPLKTTAWMACKSSDPSFALLDPSQSYPMSHMTKVEPSHVSNCPSHARPAACTPTRISGPFCITAWDGQRSSPIIVWVCLSSTGWIRPSRSNMINIYLFISAVAWATTMEYLLTLKWWAKSFSRESEKECPVPASEFGKTSQKDVCPNKVETKPTVTRKNGPSAIRKM